MTIQSETHIRRVRLDEAKALREISVATFIDTYAQHNTAGNMASYIEKSFDLERLQSELDSENTHYYFAERGIEALGYLKLNFDKAQTNRSLGDACEIERIYVAPEYKGRKIGKALFEKAVQCSRDAALNWLWLGVWDQNVKAIAFYKKMGFEVFGSHDFKLGTEEQSDLLMRLKVTNN